MRETVRPEGKDRFHWGKIGLRFKAAAAVLMCLISACRGLVSSANPANIIVFPLSGDRSTGQYAWIGEGVAFSLARQLAGPGVTVIDGDERTALVESIDLPPRAPLSQGSMIRVAQKASADLAIMGSYSGTEQNFRITVRVLDVKGLRMGGDMAANGPLSALPQLENELAWMILTNMGLRAASSREIFQQRTRKIPNAAFAYFVQSWDASNDVDQLNLLLKAVGLHPDFPQAQFQIGRLYYHGGDYARAIPHLALAGGQPGTAMECNFMLGNCYLQKDQVQQAIQAYAPVLQVSRRYEVLNNLGVANLRRGDLEQALSLFLEAGSLARTDATVSLNLAIARHAQGNDNLALAGLEAAVKSHPQNGMLHFVLSYLLKAQGQTDRAADSLGRARRLGINVDKLQLDDSKSWLRPLLTWASTG